MSEEAGEPDIKRLLGAHRKLKSDPNFALSELRDLAEMQSVSAMIHLGDGYERGLYLLQRDLAQAERWYRRAADRGLLSAYYFLGRLYLEMARYEEALGAFRYAAAKEYPPALHYLGRMYYFGAGVQVDLAKSEGYLERASVGGNILAKILLARILRNSSSPSRRWRGILLRGESTLEMLYTLIVEGRKSQRFR